MNTAEFIEKSLTESQEYIALAIRGLTKEDLAFRPSPHSNNIAFLLWHLARVEDLWINRNLMARKQTYESDGWYKKFGTPAQDSGFGYDVEKLNAWPVPELQLIQAYAAEIRQKTLVYLRNLNEKRLDDEVDFGWRKGTVGTALSHLVTEVAEHAGQIGYIRGIMKGIEPPPPRPARNP